MQHKYLVAWHLNTPHGISRVRTDVIELSTAISDEDDLYSVAEALFDKYPDLRADEVPPPEVLSFSRFEN
jgi:hypothetical protein